VPGALKIDSGLFSGIGAVARPNGVNVRPRKPPTCWPIIFIVRYYDVDQRFVACQLSHIALRPALFDFPSVPAGPSL